MIDLRDQIDIYAQWDGHQLDLIASSEGLEKLIHIIKAQKFGIYKISDSSTFTDGTNISTIEINHGNGRLIMKILGDALSLSGSQKFLSIFATNLERLKISWAHGEPEHLHNDSLSNPFLISPDSEPFIVSQKHVAYQ